MVILFFSFRSYYRSRMHIERLLLVRCRTHRTRIRETKASLENQKLYTARSVLRTISYNMHASYGIITTYSKVWQNTWLTFHKRTSRYDVLEMAVSVRDDLTARTVLSNYNKWGNDRMNMPRLEYIRAHLLVVSMHGTCVKREFEILNRYIRIIRLFGEFWKSWSMPCPWLDEFSNLAKNRISNDGRRCVDSTISSPSNLVFSRKIVLKREFF